MRAFSQRKQLSPGEQEFWSYIRDVCPYESPIVEHRMTKRASYLAALPASMTNLGNIVLRSSAQACSIVTIIGAKSLTPYIALRLTCKN